MNEFFNWLLATVHSVDPTLRVFLAGIAMLFETSILLGLIVPGDSIVLVAATAVNGPVEFISLAVAVILGSLAGESIGFWLGHFFGPRIRRSRLGQRVGEKNWVRAETYLERRGGIAVAISRFLPVFHSLVPLVVGTSAMRYRVFIAWTVPACVIWAVTYISVGAFAAGSYRKLQGQLQGAGLIFVGIIVVALIIIFVIRRAIERRESRHMDPNE
ncbi:MAG: rane-associated protein [Actinomycetota bacterium]|nr:rane-associated protein [Actinomycetota bacterium]